MREISLITGQLHRAIYNLNDEARRTANQKFESGLPSAPHRSLKKAFEQFRDSLETGDSQVRRRTASLLVTLIRSLEQIAAELRPNILQMIELGLADDDPLVREATVESYSLLLEKVDEQSLCDGQGAGAADDVVDVAHAAGEALNRILKIAIADPAEIVREAAAVGVAVQKSEAVQNAGVRFLLGHVNDRRYRFACRSIASLAEFPMQQSQYVPQLNRFLNDSDARCRRAALSASLRLAKLESLPWELLPNVTRRLFDAEATVAVAAQEVMQAAIVAISRTTPTVADYLTECMWLAKQDEPNQHLPAIFETDLVRENIEGCYRLCHDRWAWLQQTRSGDGVETPLLDRDMEGLLKLADGLVDLDGRSSMGWVAASFVRLAGH
jgi:hypothetical protein